MTLDSGGGESQRISPPPQPKNNKKIKKDYFDF
jgi:hypothetical protein